jgi:hypothetical protein
MGAQWSQRAGVVSVEQLARILSALGAMLVLRDPAADLASQPMAQPRPPAGSSGTPRRAPARDRSAPRPPAKKRAARGARKAAPTAMPAIAPKKGSW